MYIWFLDRRAGGSSGFARALAAVPGGACKTCRVRLGESIFDSENSKFKSRFDS